MSVNVEIIESERGWGQKLDSIKEFATEQEAIDFCKEYNDKYNTQEVVPDWYMYARLEYDNDMKILRGL